MRLEECSDNYAAKELQVNQLTEKNEVLLQKTSMAAKATEMNSEYCSKLKESEQTIQVLKQK